MNTLYENKDRVTSDVLFTHCDGKSRAKDAVHALKAVDVTVVTIYDFGLINLS